MRVLAPDGPFDRLMLEAVVQSAQLEAAAERTVAANQAADRVVGGLIELLVAAGVLKRKD